MSGAAYFQAAAAHRPYPGLYPGQGPYVNIYSRLKYLLTFSGLYVKFNNHEHGQFYITYRRRVANADFYIRDGSYAPR